MAKGIQDNNPDNYEAKTLYGYAALKADRIEEAKEIFEDLASQEGEPKILGNEGKVKIHFDELVLKYSSFI